ncbi:MAG: efflux transporter outer membrane subunit [Flavobacteriales bacterium]|nr:efflux transporter outer membrane subunit [Flavobacteriales bacterium]
MIRLNKYLMVGGIFMLLSLSSCIPALKTRQENKAVPNMYASDSDTTNSAQIKWGTFFNDPYLTDLIDTALKNNQELNMMLWEINIANNEVRARKGEYLPFLRAGVGAGIEHVGEYTSQGVSDANDEYAPGKHVPANLQDYMAGFFATWEIDIWKKLRNRKQSAFYRYLGSIEGKNFMVTRLVSEIANSYYELLALDNQLRILKQNIQIQQNALAIVKLQKQAARATELAVRKFEAEVLKNRSRQFEIQQKIIEAENRINFLVGRFPQPVQRNSDNFIQMLPNVIQTGIPSQLLENRPDVRQAELQLAAAKLDVKAAKAEFYPSLSIKAGVGYQAFNLKYFITTPQSLLYNIAADLMAPLVNRNAIKAKYLSAGSKQMQAVYNYERTILGAYTEVANQMAMIENLANSYDLRSQQVAALTRSIDISTGLFKSARADYMEVLMTQRDALDARMELIDTKKSQLNATVNIYQALGGGWTGK